MFGLELDALPGPAASTPPPPPGLPPGAVPFSNDEMFLPTGYWRKPLAPDAPLHPDSDRWARNVCEQFDCRWDTPQDSTRVWQRPGAMPGNAWFSHGAGGSPLYVVGPDQPTQKVYLVPTGSAADSLLQEKWNAVPVPDGVVAGNSSDKTVCIWQPSTDKMWEFWVWNKVTDQPWNYQARWGGAMYRASESRGWYASRFDEFGNRFEWYVEGHTATSAPVNAGAVQPEEIARGYIGHALHLTTGNAARWDQFLPPARRSDGDGTWWKWTDGEWGQWRSGAQNLSYPDMVPEGAYLRFPADLDLSPYTGLTRMLVEAIRDYGMFITDRTHGGCSIRFRELTTYTAAGLPNPWTGLITDWPNNYIWAMPLHRLQVVDPAIFA
jgi:hypothetical protein